MSRTTASDTLSHLYREHHGWLRGWLRHRLGNADDAADLAQDAFLRVLKARNAESIREPRHYLTTIAKGLVVDLFRRRALEAEYLAALAHLPEPEWPSPETRALAVEALIEIDTMLDGLGERIRQVFVLSQCGGFTYPEIAMRTGLALRTVNKYMAAAMEHCCLYRLRQAATTA
ncbi:sigma-70 family RNA polymerase sigma factor [Thauera linaloolentis]|uniref:RNA polymerase sigma factor, FecI family protein n=1 Tax=Thauera linaloolentis (strain DSM 12138 / JCM 21573 / CCUG 41526 / CIP 105981 / IAM 15112 / NBRC 102519 / 47Lol) TaxID=1123367 RepID=N6Y878_THAL4|nr:sigma-70 family RNA polymerase sigma factor [Thauera linaloolentis]ENO90466.1 RNA polymerase sigma factor, FecI family protein [Thauera linaloolentis 47Lol = DSM 12138]MCM8566327.1 sigma-70 family RNA polymerase sigma factor [Thauera linaloolentis]